MKVTVFGAAFDPPHLGHQKIVLSLLEQGLADSIWLLPVKEHAFGKKLAPEMDRLAMTELLAKDVRKLLGDPQSGRHVEPIKIDRHPELVSGSSVSNRYAGLDPASQKDVEKSLDIIRVERFELNKKGTSYTYQTLQELSILHPQHTFSFVIGSDNLARFHEWQNYVQMLEKFPFFVYPRKGFTMLPIRKGMIVLENVEPIDVSSTQVRNLVAKGQGVDHLVPESIINYISKNKLYE